MWSDVRYLYHQHVNDSRVRHVFVFVEHLSHFFSALTCRNIQLKRVNWNKQTNTHTRHITNSFHSLDNHIFQIFEYKQGWKHYQWVCACIRVRAYMSNFTLCCVLCCLYVVMSVCLWPWRGMRCGIGCERVSYLCSAPRGTRPGTVLELSVWPPAGRGWRSV